MGNERFASFEEKINENSKKIGEIEEIIEKFQKRLEILEENIGWIIKLKQDLVYFSKVL